MADSTELLLWKQVVTVLTAGMVAGQPLEFVKTLYEGVPAEQIPSNAFPMMILELDDEQDEPFTVPNRVMEKTKFKLECWINHPVYKSQIVGDGTNYGILDFTQRAKNVLQADQTLGGIAGQIKLRFPRTVYLLEHLPARGAQISVELWTVVTTTGR